MGFEECVVKAILFHLCELTFDSVEPGSIRGCPHEYDIVVLRPLSNGFVLVRREVIKDQIDRVFPGIHLPQSFERADRFQAALALEEVSPHPVMAKIVKCKKMSDTMLPGIRCR
jgi:hypothetical protein